MARSARAHQTVSPGQAAFHARCQWSACAARSCHMALSLRALENDETKTSTPARVGVARASRASVMPSSKQTSGLARFSALHVSGQPAAETLTTRASSCSAPTACSACTGRIVGWTRAANAGPSSFSMAPRGESVPDVRTSACAAVARAEKMTDGLSSHTHSSTPHSAIAPLHRHARGIKSGSAGANLRGNDEPRLSHTCTARANFAGSSAQSASARSAHSAASSAAVSCTSGCDKASLKASAAARSLAESSAPSTPLAGTAAAAPTADCVGVTGGTLRAPTSSVSASAVRVLDHLCSSARSSGGTRNLVRRSRSRAACDLPLLPLPTRADGCCCCDAPCEPLVPPLPHCEPP